MIPGTYGQCFKYVDYLSCAKPPIKTSSVSTAPKSLTPSCWSLEQFQLNLNDVVHSHVTLTEKCAARSRGPLWARPDLPKEYYISFCVSPLIWISSLHSRDVPVDARLPCIVPGCNFTLCNVLGTSVSQPSLCWVFLSPQAPALWWCCIIIATKQLAARSSTLATWQKGPG